MALFLAPIPTEILPWMQGFASVYLRSHAAMTEEVRDNAGAALLNFHIRVMSPTRTPILGLDRLKIARSIAEAGPAKLTEWERELETLDALTKKNLCEHLSVVAFRLRHGAAVFAGTEEPIWVEDLLARGLMGAVTPVSEPPAGVTRTAILFLAKSVHDALAKNDAAAAIDAIDRLDERDPPGACAFLRKFAKEMLTREDPAEETEPKRLQARSDAGQKALLVLADRSDAGALDLLHGLLSQRYALFGETPYGGRYLDVHSAPVFRTVAEAVLTGDYGLDGQHLLETCLSKASYVLPSSKRKGLGEAVLKAVFKHRSGLMLMRLIAANPRLDDLLMGLEFRKLPLHFTVFHLDLLGTLARKRGEALRWFLHHGDLREAILRASRAGREHAVTSLIGIYYQAATYLDRLAVAEALEATGLESAAIFFEREISRLNHVPSFRNLVGRLVFGETSEQTLLRERIARIRSGRPRFLSI
ncbi:MAG TPA: hypothetical protein VFX30_12750 [bacterium]|nr:hypothetical protein [bacterium]